MADPIAHELLTDQDTVREGFQLALGLADVLNGPVRDEHAVLIAIANLWLEACEMTEVCPFDTLAQIADAIDTGAISLETDPARGEFVHEAPSLTQ
jgi:hypothetical protein